MASFELNEIEKQNQKTLIDSIKVLYGEDVAILAGTDFFYEL
jgi:hypothetical protein